MGGQFAHYLVTQKVKVYIWAVPWSEQTFHVTTLIFHLHCNLIFLTLKGAHHYLFQFTQSLNNNLFLILSFVFWKQGYTFQPLYSLMHITICIEGGWWLARRYCLWWHDGWVGLFSWSFSNCNFFSHLSSQKLSFL